MSTPPLPNELIVRVAGFFPTSHWPAEAATGEEEEGPPPGNLSAEKAGRREEEAAAVGAVAVAAAFAAVGCRFESLAGNQMASVPQAQRGAEEDEGKRRLILDKENKGEQKEEEQK